jgi:hypothetical protein
MNTLNYLGSLPKQVFGIDALMASIGVTALIVVLIIWTLAWKGMALWKAAQRGSKVWFILLLLVNTVGILDIIYIYGVNRRRK